MRVIIPKRISTAVLSALQAGVVPRIGLEYLAVGRKKEIETVLQDLEDLSGGAGAFRFIVGRYGSGKSFFLQALRNYAMDRDFVVADADLSPEKRLSGSAGQGLQTYRELTQRLSTKLRPEGGALEAMLQKWIGGIQQELRNEGESGGDLASKVEWKMFQLVSSMEDFAHGFDFAQVVAAYYRAFLKGDDEKKRNAVRWLRGEYSTRTEARVALGTGEIISDENWYDYAKLFAVFSAKIGYRGLLLFIDESVNLYKIANRQSRENNYEKLLSLFNDVMQGKARHLGIYLGGTPQFVEDARRGLFSYAALKSRLSENRFVRQGYPDFTGPILRLARLSHEEIFVLLERITEIHAQHYDWTPPLGEEELTAFMELVFASPGADEFITPREITRDFLGLLNLLKDDSGSDFYRVIKGGDFAFRRKGPGDDLYTEFEF
ncbi:MAG: ATP-binding protein [Spirochaetaceae bacterium]|jgi:hypothetical protein|nr:ATP-binding protein [Spirochaetaceae bacterium]